MAKQSLEARPGSAREGKRHTHGEPREGSKMRRNLFWGFVTLGVVAFIVAVVATFALPNDAEGWLIGALVALVVALAGEIVLLVMGGGRVFDAEEEWYDWEEVEEKPKATQIVLKCAKCSRTFPLLDDGTRPLRADCPHCGRSGLLK